MKNTKKTFQYVFVALVISLSFMIYLQWFSPSKPVQFFNPLEDKIPKELTSLPVIDIDGEERLIEMKDSPYTVFIVDYSDPEFNGEGYPTVSKAQEIINKRGIRTVYLWKTKTDREKEGVKRIRSMVQPDQQDSRYILNGRILAQYQKEIGLEISSSRLVFAYNDSGELIYENDRLYPEKMVSEILIIPKLSEIFNVKDGGE